VVTGVYDEALRDSGLTSTQLTVMLAIESMGNKAYAAALVQALHMDPSTLSRNLKILERERLIVANRDFGRRCLLKVTTPGRKALREARPGWIQAQKRLTEMLGEEGVAALLLTSENLD